MRDGVEMKLSIMVGSKSDDDHVTDEIQSKNNIIPNEKIDGITVGVSELTADHRKRFDIPVDITGVLVANVEIPTEISVGDVITKINQTKIANISELKSIIKKIIDQKTNSVALYLFSPRERQHFYVAFRLTYNLQKKNNYYANK
jgi:S1-C subfamily serine protease